MADEKISDLGAAGTLTLADLMELEQPSESAGTRSRKITLALLKAFFTRSQVSTLATSGSVAVDYALGDYFTLALAGNVSGFTFSNLPGSGHGATLMIQITQDTTARTVAWPSSFKWAGGVAGAVSTGSGAVDVLAITTFDNGTTWRATLAKAFA